MLRSAWRVVFNCFAKLEKGLFPVYRLEEDVGLLQEGAVRLSLSVLRACSYKAKAEAWHQGFASIIFKGFISVFFNPKKSNPCKSVESVGHTL